MCTFITVAIPKAARLDEVREAFKSANLALNSAGDARPNGVDANEDYFFTATKHCDCGTMLGSDRFDPMEPADLRRLKLEADLKKRGLSASKIERRLKDFEHSEEKASRENTSSEQAGEAELTKWVTLITELLDQRVASHVGVAVNEYSGSLSRIEHTLRRVAIKRENFTRAALTAIQPETLVVFR